MTAFFLHLIRTPRKFRKKGDILKDLDLRNNRWVHIGLLLFVTFLFYIPTWDFDFIVDDPYLIVDRVESLSDLSNIPSYFSQDFWNQQDAHFFYYRPLVITINALSVYLFGLEPGWFHLTNLLFHLLNLALLYLILIRVLDNRLTVFWALLIYSLHPFTVPTVAWVSGRTDLFAMFFMLLSLWCLTKNTKNSVYLILSLLFYFLGCLSKETAVLLPVIVMVYFLSDSTRRAHWKRVFFFLPLTFLYIAMRVIVRGNVTGEIISASFDPANLLYSPTIAVYYLAKIFVPTGITFIPNSSDMLRFSPFAFGLSVLLLGFALYSIMRKEYTFSIIWSAVFAAPVLYFLPVGYPGAAYYLYIPLIGIILIFTDLLRRLLESLSERFAENQRDRVFIVVFMLALAWFGYHGFGTLVKYSDEATLWQDSLNIDPDNMQALKNLGVMYYEQGDYQNAVGLLEKIRQAEPEMASIYWNLIAAYSNLKDYEKADIVWEMAKERGVVMEQTSINYALTLIERGFYDQAMLLLNAVQKKNPSRGEPYRYMGMIELYYRADTTAAVDHFATYLAFEPSDPDTAFFRDIVEGEL